MDNFSNMALDKEPELTTETTDMDDIYNWAIQSPYSPLNLQHLDQPRLQGVPREVAAQFTFRDAFEDLLRTSSGRRHGNSSTWEMLHRKTSEVWAPLNVFHWVSSLGAQGLWGSYFALSPSLQNRVDWAPRNVDTSYRQLYFYQRPSPPLNHQDDIFPGPTSTFARLLLQAFREQPGVRAWKDWKDPQSEEQRIREVVDKAMKEFAARHSLPGPAPTSESSLPTNSLPNPKDSSVDEKSQMQPPDVKTTIYPNGSKRVQTTERRSRNGITETTITSQHFDANGNLLAESRERSSSRTWSGRIPGGEASFSWSWDSNNVNKKG
ncbi:hypothetical protein GGR50DRAFT_131034 [Xylaria sp. CBS 124048]|nr:hypothetical protein GGR50DRAFT_131034 [Xylaria sp. CBS 124048]